jgi:hypothetical protein
LLAKPRQELTSPQGAIVDGLKAHCPGYAVMRALMLAFRSILRQPARRSSRTGPIRTAEALHRWLDRAEASGIAVIVRFVEQLRRGVRAVEAAVTERWSNGPVAGHVNPPKTLKRQMYGQAGVELLRARLIPLACDLPTVQRV